MWKKIKSLKKRKKNFFEDLTLLAVPNGKIPVMAAVAVRKKVVSVGHFSPSFCFQSLQIFLFAC